MSSQSVTSPNQKTEFSTGIEEDGRGLSLYNLPSATMVNRRVEDANHTLPPPGYNGVPPDKYVSAPSLSCCESVG